MFDRFFGRGPNVKATREATSTLYQVFFLLGIQKPPQKLKYLYYLYSSYINFSVCIFLPVAFGLSYFYEYGKITISQLLTSIQVFIDVLGLPPKFITIIICLKKLAQGLAVMDHLDSRCKRPDEFEKIRNCVMVGNRLAVFYVSFYVTFSTVTFIAAVTLRQPPYSIYMPLMDWHKSGSEFALQSIIEYILMSTICFHQAASDVYGVIFIYVIRTHMRILVERVKRLGTDKKVSNEEHYQQLIMCIKDHQTLLCLLDIISPVISITIFVQFTITAAILGTTLINIFIFADTSTQIACLTYFSAVLVQTSPCTYHATCLMDESNQLPIAIFHSDWADKDVRFRKMMIFFMMRSQTPVTLTAMKLFPITLNTSLGIAKFSFSVYTLIKGMDFGQK